MTRIFYPIVDINDTIKEDKVTDIHITKDNIYYNTEAYIIKLGLLIKSIVWRKCYEIQKRRIKA